MRQNGYPNEEGKCIIQYLPSVVSADNALDLTSPFRMYSAIGICIGKDSTSANSTPVPFNLIFLWNQFTLTLW